MGRGRYGRVGQSPVIQGLCVEVEPIEGTWGQTSP